MSHTNKPPVEAWDAPYSLFHVNTKTGEKIRHPLRSFPTMPRHEALQLAIDSRVGAGRGGAYHDDWRTEAHPELPENLPAAAH